MRAHDVKVLSALLGVVVWCSSTVSFAQADDEESRYAYGVVKEVTGTYLVVREYDDTTEEELDVTYSIDPTVPMEHGTSWQEIGAGDEVDITYLIEGNERVAIRLTVWDSEQEDREVMESGESDEQRSVGDY